MTVSEQLEEARESIKAARYHTAESAADPNIWAALENICDALGSIASALQDSTKEK